MSSERKQFDRAFKLRAVELSYERENIKDLAIELGIRPGLLYRWRREFGTHAGKSFPGKGKQAQTQEEAEIARLKKELAEATMERDILKKAVSIFSRSDGKSTRL